MLSKVRPFVFAAFWILACSSENTVQPQTGVCAAGTVACNGVCVNTQSDPANCGQCGVVCDTGLFCSVGVCSATCGANLTACNAACVDLTSDAANCGQCGVSCGTGTCVSGACVASATGGSPGTGGSTSTVTVNPGVWNASIVSAAASAIPTEYTNWRNKYFKACSNGLTAGIWHGGGVYSEGVGYGMLITANAGTQADFDAVNAFYKAGQKSGGGLLNWSCSFDQSACSVSCSGNGATDGDLDIAAALIQAGKRWGGTYAAEATTVIQALRASVVETCGSILDVRPGDVWGGCTETNSGNAVINPSYFSPAYYRAFAALDAEGAATWNKLVEDTYPLWTLGWKGHPDKLFLWPDAQQWTGSAYANFKHFGYNGYDACRVPWRIATDYAWSGDSRAKELLALVGAEIDSAGITTNTTGGPAYPNNSAFIGSLALSGIAISQEKADAYYNAWMSASLDDTPYFQGTLRMLYLLLAGGQFASPL